LGTAVTKLLAKAIEQISVLPPETQDVIAQRLLAGLSREIPTKTPPPPQSSQTAHLLLDELAADRADR